MGHRSILLVIIKFHFYLEQQTKKRRRFRTKNEFHKYRKKKHTHTDGNGCTALHYAVTLGHADATYLLLDLGADPNRQDRKGRTPAHCGCAKGQFETVMLTFSSFSI